MPKTLPLMVFTSLLGGCAPWALAGEARLGAAGFHPGLSPGARLAGSARVVEDPVVDVRLGPELVWSEHAAFGHALSASFVPALRFHTPIALVVGVEVPLGVAWVLPAMARWSSTDDGYVATAGLGPVAPRVGVALTLHLDLGTLTGTPVAPYVRYEQALLAPFADNAGIPLLPTSHIGVGVELQLPN